MSLSSDPAVTKVTIILDKPSDWEPWFQLRREKAVVDDVWKYCDISKPKSELPQLIEPKKPQVSQVKADASEISQLNAAEIAMYQDLLNDWRQEKSEYNQSKRKMGELLMDISRTVAVRHLYLINGKDDPYDRFVALKQQLAPTTAIHTRDLVRRYRALQEKPQGRSIERWLDDWIQITNQGKEAELPEMTGHRAQDDFLTVIRTIAPEWAAACHRDLIRKETMGDSKNIPSLSEYVSEFRIYHRRVGEQLSSLGTYATLGITDQSQDGTRNARTQQSTHRNFQSPLCICGDRHLCKNCWYLVQDHPTRPKQFKVNEAKRTKIIDALKNPEQLRKIEGYLAKEGKTIPKEFLNAISKKEPLRLDDGKTSKGTSQTFATYRSFSATLPEPTKELEVPSIINRWILDPGSNIHVCNSTRFNWTETRKASPQDFIFAGETKVAIQAWGEVILNVDSPQGLSQVQLTDVALVEGFFTNVVSLSRCRARGMHFDSGRDAIYHQHPKNVVCSLKYDNGHWIVDAENNDRPPIDEFITLAAHRRAYKPSREDRRPISASYTEAHELFGHPSKEVLDHLQDNVNGIVLRRDAQETSLQECETCIEAKMTAQISRRQPENRATRPFYRIAIDLVQLVPTGNACYNGDKYLLHAICEHSKWHESKTLPQKTKSLVLPALKALINKIQRQYGYTVVVLKIDGERAYGLELYNIAQETGMKIELRAPDTPEQLGLAEIAGNVIIIKSRAYRIHAKLPKSISNELAITATHIANITPTRALNWKTPYEIVHGKKPSVAHLAPIGCKSFVLNKHLKQADKLESRSFIGYLVGYDSTNIFRIWLPKNNRVIRVRDVIFQRLSLYGDEPTIQKEEILQQEIEILDIPHPQYDDIDWNELLEPEQLQLPINNYESTKRNYKEIEYLPTPEATPEPTAHEETATNQPEEDIDGSDSEYLDMEDQIQQQILDDEDQQEHLSDDPVLPRKLAKGWTESDEYVPDRYSNNAPRKADPNVSSSNIISGKRTRKPTYLTLAAYYQAFAAGINPTAPTKLIAELPKTKLHRNQLPPPPKRWKDLKKHPFGEEFIKAAHTEFNDCWRKNCFERTTATTTTVDTEVLPLMWVFNYKCDEDGYLYKFKARLCVRGDLQESWGETYAATLAMKVFRALIAIAAAFDLEMFQFDALNAFLNAKLSRKLHCYTPEGFTDKYGELLQLLRALYGLKEAPLLWYEELSSTLKKLGLKPVPGVPCLYSNDELIVFFYVDDIVVLAHPRHMDAFNNFERRLLQTYEIRALGELRWFLGIRVIRDKSTRTIKLIQDAFIDKIANKFGLEKKGIRYPDAPLRDNYLPPSTEEPNPARTKQYQQLVGSLAYIATSTRPDVARAHSILARHLQNPGQKHLYAAQHVWRYLIHTKYLAIGASAGNQQGVTSVTIPQEDTAPIFYGASDAAFSDEPETRRSSQGYLFMLYGLPIDWKATVQRSITKSTTEAELLALSLAGSEMEWWNRFFKAIDFNLEFTPALWCDNQQTVSIATKPIERLQTKLKHVDIHHHWLRQEVSENRLHVEWKPTAQMPADGLTKILSRQKHLSFTQQLGLTDVSSRIEVDTDSEGTELSPSSSYIDE